MFNLDDYYIGLVFVDKNYNPLKAARYLGDINYDPFYERKIVECFVLGITVLLKKDNDDYHLIEYERYHNDLKVKINTPNRYGIDLRYIKPFKEVYQNEYKIYDNNDLENNEDLLEEAIISGPFYVSYDKSNKTYDLRIMDDSLDNIVREEYFNIQRSIIKNYIKK